MKSRLLPLLLACACASVARADFNPVTLTPGSFTADVIVEKAASKPINDYVTATMDGGTNNNAWVWYEQGYDVTRPSTGIPHPGTTFASVLDANHTFQLATNYSTNDVILVTTNGHPTATLTVLNPVAAQAISILNAGGGASTIAYIITHQGGGTETGTLSVNDWFNTTASPYAFIAGGRVNMDNGQTGNQYGNVPRMFYTDITLTDTVNPVTSIRFDSTSGSRAVICGLSTSSDGTTFAPVSISGYNRDMYVEASAPLTGSLYTKCNVVMDSGATNLTGNVWYEVGFNTGAPTTGVPLHGTSISGGSPLHTFTMAASYTANDVIYIGNYTGFQTGTFTLTTPTAFTGLSFLDGAGNGPVVTSVTVHFADSSTETYSFSILDWFNAATAFYTPNGRFNPQDLTLNNVNSGSPRFFNNDITLVNTASPVTSIDFTYSSGGRAMIFAVAGQTVAAGPFASVAVTGYDADGIVEASAARFANPLYTATSASMDGGTNNTANTWYERGYYRAIPNSGLPPAGSTIDSLAQPDHHYTMPASYAANNCIFVDPAHPSANLTIASPATYSAISFLSATANGTVTNQAIMQYADGTSETNTFLSRDWFNNTPVAYYANGRVNVDTRTINNDPGRATAPANPRLYEAQFALGNSGSAVTNVILKYLNPTNSTGRAYVFAVSATAGAVPPIIASVSVTPGAALFFEGSNLVFNAIITGGTLPITYQWQKGTNGVYVNLTDGGRISGVTTTNMTITGGVPSDSADYRLVASNITGPVNSGIATVGRMLAALPDVTAPGDSISIISGTTSANEPVIHAIDNVIQKYLNFSTSGGAPFAGPVGFIVKPGKGNTIVNALRIYTANDTEARDPADYVLEGSLDGASFTAISAGPLALPTTRNTVVTDVINPLVHAMQEVRFANTAGYSYYRVTFNNVKDAVNANSMQIGEFELLGVLNPNPPPTFSVSPTDVAANEGTTATFTSLAVGPAPLTYQWYDVTAGDPGTLLATNTSANLQLPSVTPAQNGNKYRVVATNPYGSVTNPSPVLPAVQLTVNTGPVAIISDLAPEVLFYAGRSEQLTIGVSGSSPFYQWQSNGVNLVDGGRVSGAKSNVLTLSNLRIGDAAAYQVVVSNLTSGPITSQPSSLYVTTAPNFHTNGVGWQFLNAGSSLQYFSGDNLLVLTDAGNEQRAAWFTTRMNIDAFKASFVYQDVGGGGADGTAFVIQNSPQGTNALGGGGGSLAYAGIPNSAAVMFNIYANNTPGIALRTNGAAGAPYDPTPPVDISNGDPIRVNLVYVGSTLQVTLSNTVTAGVFTTNYNVGSLSSIVGTNLAFIGITAATGGTGSSQQVSNFQYVPIPALAAQNSGGSVNLTWPASIGGYGAQTSSNLLTPVWSDLGATISQVGSQNQATVSPTNAAAFYRLDLVPTP